MKNITLSTGRTIGLGYPCYIIAEIGINHNGSLETAKKLIDAAIMAKVDAIKFQKRTPELCVPLDQWEIQRDTPWGEMSYIDYKRKTEFSNLEYSAIDQHARENQMDWFASPWDVESVDFLNHFNPIMYKLASASLTDVELIDRILQTGSPLMISTGMSTQNEIVESVKFIRDFDENYPLMIAHSTSAYPCKLEELNLTMIKTLIKMFPNTPIGYSGHETGLATTLAAVVMGATFVERHFTLDRAMWGSDHAASVEPQGMAKLVKDIRDFEISVGDGIKRVYDAEVSQMKKLRKYISSEYIA
jgi:N-acetylneuraminate synthase